jgi:hypothetical protein
MSAKSEKVQPLKRVEKSKQELRLTRRKEMAELNNARVIICNVVETYAVVDLAMYLDQGIKRLRNRLMVSIDSKTGVELLEKATEAICSLDDCVREISQTTGVTWYEMPRAVKQLREQLGLSVVE